MCDPFCEVGVEQDIDAVVDFLFADHPDVQRPAHAALRAFGGDQITRGERHLGSGAAIGQYSRHAAGTLAERCQLGIEAQHPRSSRFRKSADDRLKIILGAEAILDRRHRHVLCSRATGHPALDLGAGERFGPHDQPHPAFLQAGFPDRGVDTALPEDFHRPCIDAARFRRKRSARVALDQHRGHAMPGQEEGGGEADGTAAGNQNGDVEHFRDLR